MEHESRVSVTAWLDARPTRRLPELRPFDPREASPGVGLWGHAPAFPFPLPHRLIGTEVGAVPLEPYDLPRGDRRCWLLREDLEPSGAWTDRGAALFACALREAEHRSCIHVSRGNSALSLARMAQPAGVHLTAYLPAATRDARKVLVRRHQARVLEIVGPFSACEKAARRAAKDAHGPEVHADPFFLLGAASMALCIIERLGTMPGVVVAPVGDGRLLAGLREGFAAAAAAGVGASPVLIGVQPEVCCPIARAWFEGTTVHPAAPAPTRALADNLLVTMPRWGEQALAAARSSGGAIVVSDELALDRALRGLWLAGLAVEPSAALGLAFVLDESSQQALEGAGEIVVVLTGHGLREGLSVCAGL